jgi:hypothetical protein
MVATIVESPESSLSLSLSLFRPLLRMLSRRLVPLSSSAYVHSGVLVWIADDSRYPSDLIARDCGHVRVSAVCGPMAHSTHSR